MSGPNHIVGGIVFTGIYMSMFDKNIFSQPHFLFITAFFSVLPDIDHTKSNIGKVFYPVARYLDRKFGHRTLTHSLVCYFALALLISVIEKVTPPGKIIEGATAIFIWAYGSHLIFDMMTLQGVPLFYPFKKNPCVIPGNPSFRFRSSDLKTEMILFAVFIALGFSCMNLFRHGFWNTYNRTFNTTKHIYAESLLYEKGIEIKYDIVQQGQLKKGKAWLIDASPEKLNLFDKATGFIVIEKDDKIHLLKPNRQDISIKATELRFTVISLDSLNNLVHNKPVRNFKIQAALAIDYTKENKPQSGTSIDLDYVFNPVFNSKDVDSLDIGTQKEIELLKQDISRNEQELIQYEKEKHNVTNQLQQTQENIKSNDFATREKAIKQYQQLKSIADNLKPPINQKQALQLRMTYLRKQLHIHKTQSINGYISYFTIQ